MSIAWPDIPYEPWRETCSALHLYTQIVGKYRLARTPWLNHSWHATLYVEARGFTTSLIPDGPAGIEIGFDLLDHKVTGAATDGRSATFPLGPMSVAEFHARALDLVRSLGGTPDFHGRPNEVPDPVRFAEDRITRPYDADAVTRFFQASVAVDRVLKRFRTAYLGKVSPVHLFWGSFDLAVTRFSGRTASRDCPTRSRARPTATKSRPPASGPEAAPSTFRRSIPTLILHRRASRRRAQRRTRPISIRAWASSCCPMTPCGARATRRRRSWRFWRAPTT